MAYDAPLNDMAFALQSVAGLSRLEGLEAFGNYDPELITPILEEANIFPTSWPAIGPAP